MKTKNSVCLLMACALAILWVNNLYSQLQLAEGVTWYLPSGSVEAKQTQTGWEVLTGAEGVYDITAYTNQDNSVTRYRYFAAQAGGRGATYTNKTSLILETTEYPSRPFMGLQGEWNSHYKNTWYYHGKTVNVTLQNTNLQEEFGIKAPDSNTYIPYLGQRIDLNGRALSVFSGKDSNKLNVNLNILTVSDKPAVELKDPYSIRLNKVKRNGKSITVSLSSFLVSNDNSLIPLAGNLNYTNIIEAKPKQKDNGKSFVLEIEDDKGHFALPVKQMRVVDMNGKLLYTQIIYWVAPSGSNNELSLRVIGDSVSPQKGAFQMTQIVFPDWKVANKRSANGTSEDKLYKIKQYWSVKEFDNKNLNTSSKRISFGKGINFSIKKSTDGGKTWKEKKIMA